MFVTASAYAGVPNPSRITSISSPTVTEGNAGTKIMRFVVTCDPCDLRVTATVDWVIDDGSATTANNDYVDASGNFQVTGGNGVETHNIDVTINGDIDVEPDETLTLRLTGASVEDPSFFMDVTESDGTIENDDFELFVDIELSSTESADPVTAGSGDDNLTYVVTARNNGPYDASNVVVSAVAFLPPHVLLNSVTPSVGTSLTLGGDWDIGTLNDGDSATLTFVFTVPASAAAGTDTISADASVVGVTETDTDSGNDTTSEATSVVRSSDLVVTKESSPDPVVAGESLTYTITVQNDGPSDAANVVVTDTLPAGVTFVSSTGCAEDPNGVPSCSLGTIASGASAFYTIDTTTDPDLADASILSNTASAESDSPDPTPGNSSGTEDTTVSREVDLEVLKVCPTDVVAGSGANNYLCTITVTNNGPSQASGVSMSDTLEAITGVSDGAVISVSQGTPSLVAGSLSWDVGVLDPGQDEVLVFARTVSLQAAEGSPLISNTATVTGAETDSDDTNDSFTADTNVRWPVANFGVDKVYESGGAGPVNVTLECSDSTGLLQYDPQSADTPTVLSVSRFDIDPAGSGTSCTITEEVPGGYYEADRTADCDVDPTADQGDYACTITNAVTRATFKVSKIFADGNNVDEIEVFIDCNTGLILDQDKLLSDGEAVEFVVTSFTEGVLACTITEDGESGYSGEYDNVSLGNIISSESCDYPAEDIAGDSEHVCVITNTPDPVDIHVTKDWVFTNGVSTPNIDTYMEVWVVCSAPVEIVSCLGYLDPASSDNPGPEAPQGFFGAYCYGDVSLGDLGVLDTDFHVRVVPEFPQTECFAFENIYDQAIEVDNGCGEFSVKVNQGYDCTITNTVFFEGIPTLSQYGMALLALLMLGVGFVSFRRFA